MLLTEHQLRRIIRILIRETVSDEHHDEIDEDNSEEEPIGDEGKIKTVISIAKEVKGLMA